MPFDLLGRKLMVVRGREGEVRVLSRICRHRAAELVKEPGRAKSFQCPYHAWTYGLDGRLVGAPLMEGAKALDKSECRLPEVRSEIWEGWIFVNLDPDALSLAAGLAPLAELLAPYRMSESVAVETATFDSPFNWKVLVDNFMEAYHHIAIHRDTLEPLFPAKQSYVPDNEGPYSVLVMPGREDAAGAEPDALPAVAPLGPSEAHSLVAAVVYPTHLFAPSAQSLTWYQIVPETYDHFTLRIFNCFHRDAVEEPEHQEAVEAFQAITRVIHQQDIEACEATWAGLRSGCFESGPLCSLEKAIWQFNQWWSEQLFGAAG
jgi:phenylpropionate dioxygenase-like ring-hydroxylating dioxygenase large terminal subunit